MADEEREPKLFTLTQAERTRAEVEPLLIEAVEARRKMADAEGQLGKLASRILLMGGLVVRFDQATRLKHERDLLAETIQATLDRIHSTGCLVKDLEKGLLDFPAILDNEEVYLCWRLGEDRIRFWHRHHEGFAGRKPLDPSDPGPRHSVQ